MRSHGNNFTYKISSVTITDDGKEYTEEEYNKVLQQEHPHNLSFNRTEKERELSSDFFINNMTEIQKRRDDLSNCYSEALISCEIDLKIALLRETLQKYNDYRKWCYQTEGGKIFFQDKYECLENPDGSIYSKDEMIAADLRYQLHIKNVLIPAMIERAGREGGVYQNQLYVLFPDIEKKEIRAIIDELARQKIVAKEKDGHSYLIKAV